MDPAPTSEDSTEDASFSLRRPKRVMIVGDSITQGREGDYTWRYRLWRWFQDQKIPVEFVGPWKGTVNPEKPGPPKRPHVDGELLPPEEPQNQGGYAEDVDAGFEDNTWHCSRWGWQAYEAKEEIEDHVRRHQPDYLLVALGFNDMGWFKTDADGTLESMKTLVERARVGKRDLDFVLGNVPHRSYMEGRPDLPKSIDRYNSLLKDAVPAWDTKQSRIALAPFRENYSCDSRKGGECPAGYDGLHPSALGEFEIAKAFSEAFVKIYGIGKKALVVPKHIPVRNTPIPTNVVAKGSPLGIALTWDPVYGALGYDIKCRYKAGFPGWEDASAGANRYDKTNTNEGDVWQFMVRTQNGDALKSEWSEVVEAIAHPKLAAGPSHFKTTAMHEGFEMSWNAPTGPYSDTVDLYQVIIFGQDTPGMFIMSVAVRTTYVKVLNLTAGCTYGILVSSWNANGGGNPAGAGAIKVLDSKEEE